MNIISALRLDLKPRLPDIRASELAECGLTCLAMIQSYYGRSEGLQDLRLRFPTSTRGMTLRGLIGVAENIGLTTRSIRVEVADLAKIQCPAILHWGFTHFVVLRSFQRGKAIIHDPATGVHKLTTDQLSNYLTGIAIEISPAPDFNPQKIRPTRPRLQVLMPNARGLGSSALNILILSATVQILALCAPLFIQVVTDQVVAVQNSSILAAVALGFVLLTVFQATLEGIRNWSTRVLGALFVFQATRNLVRHVFRLPLDFYDKRQINDISARVTGATAVRDAIVNGGVGLVVDSAFAAVTCTLLFLYSPLLALIVICGIVFNLLISQFVFHRIRNLSTEQLVLGAREQGLLLESLRSIATIKVMGGEIDREDMWSAVYSQSLRFQQRRSKIEILAATAQQIVAAVQYSAVVYLGARMVLVGDRFSLGMLMAFLGYQRLFMDRANAAIQQITPLRMIGLHLERLTDVLNTEPEASSSKYDGSASTIGKISVEGISFSYGASDKPVLRDLNLQVARGEFVAITGATGQGKTTLLKIMLGLVKPTSGKILLDDLSPDNSDWRDWRSKVSYIGQDDYPMAGSIAANIAFFDPNLDMDRVMAAAEKALIHDDIMAMPMRYFTVITEQGSNLSGGQRQRVLLARALYREPQLIIVDEGTANLDLATEAQIVSLIRSMDITRIVVAHRPALVEAADRVVVLRDGSLHEVNPTATSV